MYPALSEGLPVVEISAQSSIVPASSWSDPPIVIPSRRNSSYNETMQTLRFGLPDPTKSQNRKNKYHHFPAD
jgi:hypothetical protein